MSLTLKAARINAGLSAKEAAERIGVKEADTIRNWEKGKTYPNVLQLKKIEDVYGVSYNDLVFLVQGSV